MPARAALAILAKVRFVPQLSATVKDHCASPIAPLLDRTGNSNAVTPSGEGVPSSLEQEARTQARSETSTIDRGE
jgi:hypothetical protein